MLTRFRWYIVGVIVLMFPTGATITKGQQSQITAVSEETYFRVLDLVFPRTVLSIPNARYAFVLRYEPTFHAESEITILEKGEEVEIVKYTSVDGSIESKLTSILRRTGKEDPEQMAKQIRIRKESLKVNRSDIRALHDSFLMSLRSTEKAVVGDMPGTVTAVADGTAYRLWYSGMGVIQYTLSGSGIDSPSLPDELALQEWMKSVYRKLEAAPTRSNH